MLADSLGSVLLMYSATFACREAPLRAATTALRCSGWQDHRILPPMRGEVDRSRLGFETFQNDPGLAALRCFDLEIPQVINASSAQWGDDSRTNDHPKRQGQGLCNKLEIQLLQVSYPAKSNMEAQCVHCRESSRAGMGSMV